MPKSLHGLLNCVSESRIIVHRYAEGFRKGLLPMVIYLIPTVFIAHTFQNRIPKNQNTH